MNLSTAAIVPAHDEADRIRETLVALASIPGLETVIVVDDGCRDATAEISRRFGGEVIQASPSGQSSGKGNALRVGLSHARKHAPQAILLADADLGATASKLVDLVNALDDEHPVSVAAFPRAKGGGFGFVKSLTRRVLTRRTGHEFAEPLSGQRALLLPALDSLSGIAPGFGAEVGMTLDLCASDIVPREIPIPLSHRSTGKTIQGFSHRAHQGRDILRALNGARLPW